MNDPCNNSLDASVQRKQISLHAALMATQGLQNELSRAMEEYHFFLANGELLCTSESEKSMDVAGWCL